LLGFDISALDGYGLFGLFQVGFGIFYAAVYVFAGHHDFQLAVFGFGHFGFRVGDFVLQGFVGFVGFYGAALIAIFAGALFPLVYV
jgi:hypothetical protein